MSAGGMLNGARTMALFLENTSPNIWRRDSRCSYCSSYQHYFRNTNLLGAGLEAGT